MRNRFAAVSVVFVALVMTTTMVVAKETPAGEEGVWKVTVTPDEEASAKGEQVFDDTLELRGGKFHSTACEAYGFGSAPYQTEGKSWMSDTESKTEGKAHWHGEIQGDSMTGKMTWTKADGTVMNYTFSGHRAGAQTQTRKSGR